MPKNPSSPSQHASAGIYFGHSPGQLLSLLRKWSASHRIAFLLLLVMPVSASAIDPADRPLIPFGISDGQTLRVVALNLAPNRTAKLSVKFLDAEGNLVSQTTTTSISSGKIVTFDFSRAAFNNEGGRIQLRPVAVLGDRSSMGSVHVSVEVFNDEDGKTTVLWDGPPVL